MEKEKNDVLKHYGVKGMRWGIRKDRSRGSRKGKRATKDRGRNTVENGYVGKRVCKNVLKDKKGNYIFTNIPKDYYALNSRDRGTKTIKGSKPLTVKALTSDYWKLAGRAQIKAEIANDRSYPKKVRKAAATQSMLDSMHRIRVQYTIDKLQGNLSREEIDKLDKIPFFVHNDNSIMQHYGVKGMRWGVRRNRPSSYQRKAAAKGRKIERNNKSVTKLKRKAAKYGYTSAKAGKKAASLNYKRLKTISASKRTKLDSKIAKQLRKEAKYKKKSAKATYKSQKKVKQNIKLSKQIKQLQAKEKQNK